MISSTTDSFWRAYRQLPPHIRQQAREAYRQFMQDPYHPSVRFRRVHPALSIYSARIGLHYRAVGVYKDNEITWFWIGSHADYDKLLKRLR